MLEHRRVIDRNVELQRNSLFWTKYHFSRAKTRSVVEKNHASWSDLCVTIIVALNNGESTHDPGNPC